MSRGSKRESGGGGVTSQVNDSLTLAKEKLISGALQQSG